MRSVLQHADVTNHDHYRCMHFCSVGFNLVCLIYNLFQKPFFRNVSLFWGLFVYYLINDYKKIFFPLNSSHVTSETTELGINVSCLVSGLVSFFFSREQLVLQDLHRLVHKGKSYYHI